MKTISRLCKDVKNQEKSFEQNHKEIIFLFEIIENELTLVNKNEDNDPLIHEKTFAYYFLSKLKQEINDYFDNKLEITGVYYDDQND